ncbi:macrophage migration inhibitory factor-like [Rattus norvegicus]|uniref:macrophage migration inhibitory factor-like n=1 Tax=Rattus norvegicus TaxID=10116 RepID=UPI00001C9A0A|nr:macrophage migration inhibitory factor-like [Rattus norvegicus]
MEMRSLAWLTPRFAPSSSPCSQSLRHHAMFIRNTNVLHASEPEEFHSELTQQLAQGTGKPARFIAVHVVPDQLTTFSDMNDPCTLCSLHSISKIGGTQNRNYSKLLCGLLSDRLHISLDPVYINMNAANLGWNSSTLA